MEVNKQYINNKNKRQKDRLRFYDVDEHVYMPKRDWILSKKGFINKFIFF